MPIDYDVRQPTLDEEKAAQSLAALRARGNQSADLGDDLDSGESDMDFTATELSTEDLGVPLVPLQADEFTCTGCFLAHHRSQLADEIRRRCRDCVAESAARSPLSEQRRVAVSGGGPPQGPARHSQPAGATDSTAR